MSVKSHEMDPKVLLALDQSRGLAKNVLAGSFHEIAATAEADLPAGEKLERLLRLVRLAAQAEGVLDLELPAPPPLPVSRGRKARRGRRSRSRSGKARDHYRRAPTYKDLGMKVESLPRGASPEERLAWHKARILDQLKARPEGFSSTDLIYRFPSRTTRPWKKKALEALVREGVVNETHPKSPRNGKLRSWFNLKGKSS